MREKPGSSTYLIEALSSLKLTVFVFLALAVASVIGTLLPQGLSVEELRQQYGPGVASWINMLGLNDLYRSGWFRTLLFLLCVNLIVCTIERLPKTIRLLQHREDRITPQKLSKFNFHREMTTVLPRAEVESRLEGIIKAEFGSLEKLDCGDSFCAIAETGRWTRFTVYGVHLSVLLILFGALIGSVFGLKGFMNIPEGSASDEVTLTGGSGSVLLPFQVRCDKFDVSFYDTGAPKEFRSDLAVIEDGKETLKESIRVNDPLTIKGITFYQASYGSILKEADVEFQNIDTGKVYRMALPFRELRTLPETQDKVEAVEYQSNFGQFGPAIGIMVAKEDGKPTGSWVLVDRPDFHGNRIENYKIKVNRTALTYYTGLQVKKDPGVWIVLSGFTLMIVGIGLTFYTSHRKLWMHLGPGESGTASLKVVIAGRTSKNATGFEEDFDRICDRLQDDLSTASSKESRT